MILILTDFGLDGPYVGQMQAVLHRLAPEVPSVNLMADAPAFDPRLSAYLLAALLGEVEEGDVVLAVIDPGVGTSRAPLAVEIDGRWLVGPDNGLFEIALRRAHEAQTMHIVWRPQRLTASFHGRDLFAPVAASLARGDLSPLADGPAERFPAWPDDLPAIVYADGYGNLMTGLRAACVAETPTIEIKGRRLGHARTFGAVPPGGLFWYANSQGLVEIAANAASAAALLEAGPGEPVTLA